MDNKQMEHQIAAIVHGQDSGARVWLYGSRARGDFREDSDWDVLILLDKDKISEEDHERIAFPLYDLAMDYGTLISPKLYSKKDWERRNFTPFYKNVVADRRELL